MLADLYKNSEGERHCVLKGNRVDYDETLYIYSRSMTVPKSHLNFRLADVHKVGDCVSVIGASTFPDAKFYDYQGNEHRFPANRELLIQADPDTSATSHWVAFSPNTEDNGPIYVDKNNIAEATSAIYLATTASKSYELPPVVENWYKWNGTSHQINNNYIELKNIPSFVVPFYDDRYSALPPDSNTLIKNQWSVPNVVTIGDPGISITFQGQDGWDDGSDYAPRTRFAISHTGNVKMGVECIFSGDGLTNYLESPRDAASYDGVDGWFNLITKGFHGVSMNDRDFSIGYAKFYDMKKLTKIANDTYYLRDDDYYTIKNSDNYAGTSACMKVTMLGSGAPYALLSERQRGYLIKATNRSSPGMYTYFDGFSNGHAQWKSNNFLSVWYSDTEAGAESQMNTLTTGYTSDLPYGTSTSLEVVYDYHTCTFKPISNNRDFPETMHIYAMNYHFRPA